MNETNWVSIGLVTELKKTPLQQIKVGSKEIALSYKDGKFGAVSGRCLHVGGPLGKGSFNGDYIVCPWHSWHFDRCDGKARPGIPAAVPAYELKEENGHLYINTTAFTKALHAHHPAHPLTREIKREEGPLRVVGISTTAMNQDFPRYSTSDDLLTVALDHAKNSLGCETRMIKLNELKFRNCEGFYSKDAKACTWPCSITQADPEDQLDQVYDALVFWADVILISTPIRWGAASSLYFKMAERMNCIQNQITINDRVLIRNKVASFIITGGQDNIQGVAGQMLTFFGELGFVFPQFPFIAHSRGWTAEDMERNMSHVQKDSHLREGACELIARAVALADELVKSGNGPSTVSRGGRKANQ